MALVEVVIIPLGSRSPSLSRHIARAVKVLENEPELKYESNSMGTIIEGDLQRILKVIQKMHETAFSPDIMRVETLIRIDDRRDKTLTMDGKLKSLKQEL